MTFLTADDWLVLFALGIGLVAMAVAMRGTREAAGMPAKTDSVAFANRSLESAADSGRD